MISAQPTSLGLLRLEAGLLSSMKSKESLTLPNDENYKEFLQRHGQGRVRVLADQPRIQDIAPFCKTN